MKDFAIQKTVAENIHPMILASMLFTDEKICTVTIIDYTNIHQPRRKTS